MYCVEEPDRNNGQPIGWNKSYDPPPISKETVAQRTWLIVLECIEENRIDQGANEHLPHQNTYIAHSFNGVKGKLPETEL